MNIINYKNEIYVTSKETFLLNGKLIKHYDFLEKYIRVIIDDKKINNNNRIPGYKNNEETNLCHILSLLNFSCVIDNGSCLINWINKETEQYLDIVNSMNHNNRKYQYQIYKISRLNFIQDFIQNFMNNYHKLYNDRPCYKLTDEQFKYNIEFSRSCDITDFWNTGSVNFRERLNTRNILYPALKIDIYVMQKFFDTELVNIIDTGRYHYHFFSDYDSTVLYWLLDINEKYHKFTLEFLSKEIERYIDKDNLKQYILIGHENNVFNENRKICSIFSELDICNYLIQLEDDAKKSKNNLIPLQISVYGVIYELVGAAFLSACDGGHTITCVKSNDQYWTYMDDTHVIRIYNDKSLNQFNGLNYTIYDVLGDAACFNNLLLYRKKDITSKIDENETLIEENELIEEVNN
jgi:hypothetical protein